MAREVPARKWGAAKSMQNPSDPCRDRMLVAPAQIYDVRSIVDRSAFDPRFVNCAIGLFIFSAFFAFRPKNKGKP
jgi:hypothetical protein